MREIKFRAWDTTNKRMIEGQSLWIRIYPKGGLPDYHIGDTPNNNCYDPRGDLEIMQYTGLKDKNGTPIYEGDVVRSSIGEIAVVVYSGRQFTTQHKEIPKGDFDWRSSENCSFEIIGNIYSNPELLSNN